MSSSENSEKLIFVTGGSGFIAYNIVTHLLNEGYKVRTSARGIKVERLRQALSTVHDPSRFDVVDVPDVASGDFSEILKDVDGIIHTAYPLAGRVDYKNALRIAVDGSLHVLREGVKAGIRKYVTTSSISTFNMTGGGFGIHDFVGLTEKEAVADPFSTYMYTKAACDRKILEFQDEHPEVDVTILGPSWVYGPFPPGFDRIVPEPDILSLSTNLFIYTLSVKDAGHVLPLIPGYVDVRDVARVHVLALKSRPVSEVGLKRFPVISPQDSSWTDAVTHLAKERPELKDRLLEPANVPKPSFGNSVVGINPDGLERAVGFRPGDYIKWEDTILEAADSVLALEAGWKAKGFNVSVPTEPPINNY